MKTLIYFAKFDIDNKKLSKGRKLFGKDEEKYSQSFYIFLLECLMSWGIIYYNTGFQKQF